MKYKDSIPNILILNSVSMKKNNANGITLRSIFNVLPSDNLLELYWYKSQGAEECTTSIKSIQLPPKAMPLNYFARKLLGIEENLERANNVGFVFDSRQRLSRGNVLKLYAKCFIETSPILPSKSFLGQVEDFKPDAIYMVGQNFFIQKWALFFSRRYNLPIIMHYMDNWRESYYVGDFRTLQLSNKMKRQLENIEKRMPCGLVISKAMKNYYERTYGHKYLSLMNIVSNCPTQYIKHENINIVYTGGLYLNRYQSLLDVEKAIREIKNARLIIYTSEANKVAYEKYFNKDVTKFMDPLSHDMIYKAYMKADILLHVESFLDEAVKYTVLSMSTKIPEYMAAGRPLLCYAPCQTAVYGYVNETGAGISICKPNEINEAIHTLLIPENRKQFIKCGLSTIEKEHTGEAALKTFNEVFKALRGWEIKNDTESWASKRDL